MNMKAVMLSLLMLAAWAPEVVAAPGSQGLKPERPIEVSPASKRFDLMAVDTLHHRLLTAHSQARILTIVDLINNKLLAEIQVGESSGVAVDDKDGKYFVGTIHGVAVVGQSTLRKIDFIQTPGPADAMIFDARNGRLYVGHDDGKELWVIDARRDRMIGKIVIPGAPELLATDPQRRRLYLNIKPLDEVVVIDTGTNRIIANWQTPHTHSPHGLAIDLKDKRLFVAGRSRIVSIFSLPSGNPQKGVDIGPGRVDQIAYDAQAQKLYCPSSGRLVEINVGDRSSTVVASVKIPQGTHSVAVDPSTHWVWIAYADGKHSYVQAFVPKL